MFKLAFLAGLALPLLSFASAAHAVQDSASAAAKGRVTPLNVQVTYALPAAGTKRLTAKGAAITNLILKTPAFTDPHGFSLTRSLKIDPPLDGFGWHPARGEIVMIAQEIDLSASPKPDASGAYMGRLEGPTFRVRLNDLTALYANISDTQALTDALTLPMMRVSERGYPVFRVGLRDVILIAPSGRLPYTQVSKVEYLQSLIDAEAALEAQFGPSSNPKTVDYRRRLAAEKAAMTPVTGAEPACASARLSEIFGDCAAGDAAFYVRLNTDYFRREPGAGSVQLITVSVPVEGRDGHKRLEPKLRLTADSLIDEFIDDGKVNLV